MEVAPFGLFLKNAEGDSLYFGIDVEIEEWSWPDTMQVDGMNTCGIDTRIGMTYRIKTDSGEPRVRPFVFARLNRTQCATSIYNL